MKKENISSNILDVTAVGISAALLTICAWISVPAVGPFVPFTLQTFAVFLIGALFSVKVSALSVVVYIALGAVGLPVFTGFKSGAAAVTGPTGGYIVGFLFAAVIIALFRRIKPGSILFAVLGMIAGLAVCYAFGTAWFYFVFARTGETKSLASILSLCVLPFLIPDALKMALAAVLASRLSLPLSRIGFADTVYTKTALIGE